METSYNALQIHPDQCYNDIVWAMRDVKVKNKKVTKRREKLNDGEHLLGEKNERRL